MTLKPKHNDLSGNLKGFLTVLFYVNFLYLCLCLFPMRLSASGSKPVTVRWWGHAMVSIETFSGLIIVFDPYGLHLEAYKDPEVRGDLILVSHNHSDHSNVDLVKGDPRVLKGLNAGEVQPINAILDLPANALKPQLTHINPNKKHPYSERAVGIQTIASYHDKEQGKRKGNNAMFLVEVNDLRILHTGDIGQSELTQSQINKAAGVDVLVIPVGGKNTVNAKEALTIIHQLNPKYVVPVHYGVEGLRLKLDPLDMFLQGLPETFEQVQIKGNTFTISEETNQLDQNTKVMIMEPTLKNISEEQPYDPK